MKSAPRGNPRSATAKAALGQQSALHIWGWIAIALMCGMWLATASALSSRIQLVFDYGTLPTVPPALEVLAASPGMLWLLLGVAVLIGGIAAICYPVNAMTNGRGWWFGMGCMMFAQLPLAAIAMRCVWNGVLTPSWCEPWWFGLWSGAAVMCWIGACDRSIQWQKRRGDWWSERLPWWSLVLATIACGVWWYVQSYRLWESFQLGFNDFGHFTLRVLNTQQGRGLLMETPVLPPFWDHFNPGLLLLVPLAWALTHAGTIFAIQAACLAGSSLLVYAIARALHLERWTAVAMGLGWLMLPALGQMNVADTYAWQPISLAIPCMLASYWAWLSKRPVVAAALAVLAASFEEGVFVAIGCFSAMMMVREAVMQRWGAAQPGDASVEPERGAGSRPWLVWLVVWLIATFGFVAVYRWSGLAEFQTGRFAKLGKTPLEILVSPVAQPRVFFDLLTRPRNGAFLALLLGPFAFFASARFAWSMLAVGLPLLVLILWEHLPAQSIAFQYPSTLLPVLIVGAMHASADRQSALRPLSLASRLHPRAVGFAVSGTLLGIFVGQMPWSLDSLVDVKSKTYGVQSEERRELGSEDQRWLRRELEALRMYGAGSIPFRAMRILATGRIAAHCLGAKDVETVGQFWQRYDGLQRLEPALASPILRYDTILLDHRESFQQTHEETARVRDEALRAGFRVVRSRYGIDLLVAPTKQKAASAESP
ncbi:MAG: DUF2079 domain-containing protein [Pirellula sp.]